MFVEDKAVQLMLLINAIMQDGTVLTFLSSFSMIWLADHLMKDQSYKCPLFKTARIACSTPWP